ncbi:MAG: nickel-responsive transcriptional regulator NikR [Candidatus Bathyarchaeota archaeon]|nr:nickel-responsive transcriptional regulator NikR [Candidatus Bathyarchaeota archaeon]
MAIISLSIPDALLEQVDQTIKERGFASRSEIARQALRLYLNEDLKIEDAQGETVATITLIYRENADRRRLLETQHVHSGLVSTFLHAHIHKGFCLEVLILKGQAAVIRKFVDTLRLNEQIAQIKIALINQR